MKIFHSSLDFYYFFILFICIFTIYIISLYRCEVGQINILEKPSDKYILFNRYKLSDYGIDVWSLLHFLFYGFLGYLYPETFIFTMGLGIVWETFEFYIGKHRPAFLKNIGFCSTDGNETTWWYGKFSDIIVNYLGFISGKILKHKIFTLV